MEATRIWHRPPPAAPPLATAHSVAAPPRPSLVVSRRRASDSGIDVVDVASRIVDDVLRVIPGARSHTCEPFRFDDGAEGRIIKLAFDLSPGLSAHQTIAVRSDSEWTHTATFTAPAAQLTDVDHQDALSSMRALGVRA